MSTFKLKGEFATFYIIAKKQRDGSVHYHVGVHFNSGNVLDRESNTFFFSHKEAKDASVKFNKLCNLSGKRFGKHNWFIWSVVATDADGNTVDRQLWRERPQATQSPI